MSDIVDSLRFWRDDLEAPVAAFMKDMLKEAADEIERLRELLIETRAQIGMNVCGADIHAPTFSAFLKHMARELNLDYRRLCEPGYPKWKPGGDGHGWVIGGEDE